MAKFKSQMVEKEVRYADGTVKPGVVVWVPVDDAAKITSLAAAALDSGKWVPNDPKEVEKARKRVEDAEARENKRRGII